MIDSGNNPTKSALAWFGVIVFVFFAILGSVVYFKVGAHRAGFTLGGVGAALAVLFYAFRPLRMPFYRTWMRIFYPVGWTVSHIILIVIYYLVVTPIGLVLRLVGYDPMERRPDRAAKSYWVGYRTKRDLPRYFRQY